MGRDDIVSGLAKAKQQGRRVGSAGKGHQHPLAHGDHGGATKGAGKRIGLWWGRHGGAGWTRTSDNAIMSRALYHLSYGTSSAGRLESYREAAARALSFRFLSRRLASATRFLLFRVPPECKPSRAALLQVV